MGVGPLSDVIRHPPLGFIYANILANRLLNRSGVNQNGIDLMDQDWDVLILLDACRYDVYQELLGEQQLSGVAESRVSNSACTPEFLANNLDGKSFPDTVYVTANNQHHAEGTDVEFHDIKDLWRTEWEDGVGVTPEVVTEHARKCRSEYPNKRLIVHYIQPHLPFLTEIGREIHQEHDALQDSDAESVWTALRKGKLDPSEATLRRAYRENLALVLDSVESLVADLDGRIVISSDHGQLLGDRISPLPVRDYGHPQKVYHEKLVDVPYHVIENGERPEIHAGEATAYDKSVSDDVINDRLKQLGYVD